LHHPHWPRPRELDIKVYAFCLMSNHVHLIVQPGAGIAELGRLMKHLAGRQTRFVNRQAARTGTLWEGRYKSSPIETDAYLLACCRDVELNPVRARMTDTPAAYPWSSYRWHAGECAESDWLDVDPCDAALGSTAEARAVAYRALVRSAIPEGEWRLIRECLQRGQLTGSERFTDQVEDIVHRRIEHRGRGRPRKGGRQTRGRNKSVPFLSADEGQK
jgi:putative transposase